MHLQVACSTCPDLRAFGGLVGIRALSWALSLCHPFVRQLFCPDSLANPAAICEPAHAPQLIAKKMLVSTYGAVCWHDATLHVHKGQRLRGWRVCGWARQWGCRQTCIHLGRPIGGKAGGKRDRQRTLRSHIRRVRIFVLLVASRASGTCPGRPVSSESLRAVS